MFQSLGTSKDFQ